MKVSNCKKYISEGKAILSADIESGSFQGVKQVFFSYPERYFDFLSSWGDAFLPTVLIPAMISGQDVEMHCPVSNKMIKNQHTIQSVFHSWFKGEFEFVKVIVKNRMSPEREEIYNNATFFSLGVDSMYTMLKYLPANCPFEDRRISHLIYMKGLELPLSVYSKGQDLHVLENIQKVADHFKLDIIEGETNLRDIFPLVWEDYYVGAGLAATALSLSHGLYNVYIPSSHSYANIAPNPTSPLTDHLWSNESCSIIHDGAETERALKIAGLIVNYPFALNNLRVCVSNEGGSFNCCRCWKCIRTMVTLEIIGKLDSAESFPEPLPENISMLLRTYKASSLKYAIENLNLARQYGNKKLEKLLEREVRVGKLDLFREGKPFRYLISEVLFYSIVKGARKFGLFS
jgi:hypothetical protein